jgi:hypothetical protein
MRQRRVALPRRLFPPRVGEGFLRGIDRRAALGFRFVKELELRGIGALGGRTVLPVLGEPAGLRIPWDAEGQGRDGLCSASDFGRPFVGGPFGVCHHRRVIRHTSPEFLALDNM